MGWGRPSQGVLSFRAVGSMEGLETGGQPNPVFISVSECSAAAGVGKGREGFARRQQGVTSYPSQAGGRSSVCGGAEAGRKTGGEGDKEVLEQKPG